MEDIHIRDVKDNKEKSSAYAYWKKRYSIAMKNGFYVEAMVIDYALIEDRLVSFLYYSGVIVDKNVLTLGGSPFRQLFVDAGLCKRPSRFSLKNISVKTKCLEIIVDLCKKDADNSKTDNILSALINQYMRFDLSEMSEQLNAVTKWCKYRNDVIHKVLNKNIDDVQESIAKKAEEGFCLAKYFDTQEKKIKRNNKIRKAAGLPVE